MPYNATEGKARMAWGDKKNDKRANESPFNAGDPTMPVGYFLIDEGVQESRARSIRRAGRRRRSCVRHGAKGGF